jgi:predicted ferric reductase
MRHIKLALFAILALMSVLWVAAEPEMFQSRGFFAVRAAAVQYIGVLAIAAMSVAMMLALRPRAGGAASTRCIASTNGSASPRSSSPWVHWLWAQGPKWAVGWGPLERPVRGGARPALANPVEALFSSLRGTAGGIGEWAFYAAAVLIALALICAFPYRWFYKTHRLLALAYLVLAFHAVVLLDFADWLTPLGVATALLLAGGAYAAGIVLLRRVGAARQVKRRIAELNYYPGVKTLETIIDVPAGWPGHLGRASLPSPCRMSPKARIPTPSPPVGTQTIHGSPSSPRSWAITPAGCARDCVPARR